MSKPVWHPIRLFCQGGKKLHRVYHYLALQDEDLPEIMVDGERYYVLCDEADYIEVKVHFLPKETENAGT